MCGVTNCNFMTTSYQIAYQSSVSYSQQLTLPIPGAYFIFMRGLSSFYFFGRFDMLVVNCITSLSRNLFFIKVRRKSNTVASEVFNSFSFVLDLTCKSCFMLMLFERIICVKILK